MTSEPIAKVQHRIAKTFGGWTRDTTLEQMRAGFASLVSADRSPEQTPTDAGGIPAAWFGAGDGVILYCHGGGYQMGSIRSHGPLMADLAGASGCRVLGFDYRLAPEHRFPAALDDALQVYLWLLAQGTPAKNIAFAGDSAGAGLALALMLGAREQGLPLPACAAFLSPWVDMEARGETYDSNARVDPLTQKSKVLMMVKTYLGREGDPSDQRASPVNGDLAGLPPMLIHVGGDETVLGDTHLLEQRVHAAGGEVETVIWPGMIHHFQVFPELPQAQESLAQIGAWVQGRIG
ncbi:MAG: alpha/beta hydrolase [Pseudomonadota bacterium]|nr:alpha/beta hydrolase [Pseudomonadota bacterium]